MVRRAKIKATICKHVTPVNNTKFDIGIVLDDNYSFIYLHL